MCLLNAHPNALIALTKKQIVSHFETDATKPCPQRGTLEFEQFLEEHDTLVIDQNNYPILSRKDGVHKLVTTMMGNFPIFSTYRNRCCQAIRFCPITLEEIAAEACVSVPTWYESKRIEKEHQDEIAEKASMDTSRT